VKTIVALPGQGIGIEVVDATCEIMTGAGMPLKILAPPQGEGSTVPEETRRACREADAVLFGAAGPATSVVVGWLRWEMEAWGGVRPAKFYPGMRSPLVDPEGIDFVVVGENSEGMYL
jgi:isocitrate/isopropylmalate dehydrogenase